MACKIFLEHDHIFFTQSTITKYSIKWWYLLLRNSLIEISDWEFEDQYRKEKITFYKCTIFDQPKRKVGNGIRKTVLNYNLYN